MIDVTQIEGQVRESSVRKVGEVVGAHPEEAMAMLGQTRVDVVLTSPFVRAVQTALAA